MDKVRVYYGIPRSTSLVLRGSLVLRQHFADRRRRLFSVKIQRSDEDVKNF